MEKRKRTARLTTGREEAGKWHQDRERHPTTVDGQAEASSQEVDASSRNEVFNVATMPMVSVASRYKYRVNTIYFFSDISHNFGYLKDPLIVAISLTAACEGRRLFLKSFKNRITMKDLIKAFVTDLKEEGFTQGELVKYGIVYPAILVLVCLLSEIVAQ